MGKIFRLHCERSGARRVRPHPLRHTSGTSRVAGIDLPLLRELMGRNASPETTARDVHVSPEGLAAECDAIQEAMDRCRGTALVWMAPSGSSSPAQARPKEYLTTK